MWHKYKTEILIFFLAFGVRLIYAVVIQYLYGSHGFVAYSDAETFLRMANNLLSHGVLSRSVEVPFISDGLAMPLYINFLAFFLWLKVPLMGIAFVQNIFAGLSAVMVYRIGKIIFSSAAGIFAAIFISLEPASIYWNNLLMSDNLFSFLFLTAIYLFVIKRFYLFSIVLGLSTLTRPIGLYFFPLFLGMMIFLHYRGRVITNSKSFYIKEIFVVIFLFILVLSPWMIRNKILFDTYELSSAGWLNLYIFEASQFTKKHLIPFSSPEMPLDYPGQNKVIFNYDFINTLFYKTKIFELVFTHPWEYTKFHAISSIKSLNNHGYDYLMENVITAKISVSNTVQSFAVWFGQFLWMIFYGMILIAFFFVEKNNRAWYLLFLLIIVENAFLLGYSGLHQGGRYNLPALAPTALLAGYAISTLYHKIRNYQFLW